MFNPSLGQITAIRWLPCQNNTANDIPGFAVMRVTGVCDPSTVDNQIVLQVDQPNNSTAIYCVNGPNIIKAKSGSTSYYGSCSLDFPNMALYDSSGGTPAAGQTWGPKNGSWKMVYGQTGYLACGGASEGRALFQAVAIGGGPNTFITFTTASALLATDASQANCPVVVVWEGTNPGNTVTVYNELGFAADAGVDGYAKLCAADGKIKIIQIPCPAGAS